MLEQESIAIKVKADNTDAKQSFDQLRNFAKGSVEALSRELKLLSQIDAFARLKKDVSEAERSWKEATAHVAELAKKMQGIEEPSAKMVKEFDRAKLAASGLKDSFLAQRDALNNLRVSLSQAGVNTKKLGDAQRDAQVKVAALQTQLAELKQVQSDFGTVGVRSTKAIRAEMDGLSVAMNRLANSAKVSQQELSRVMAATKTRTAELRKELEGAGGQGGLIGSLSVVGKIGPGSIAAVIGAITTSQVAQAVKDVSLLAARYDTLGVAMNTVGRNAGYTQAEIEQFQKQLQATGIAAIESRTAIMRLAQAQVPLEQAAKLARIAQDAAVIGGINSSEAFERMIHGMVTAEPLILRNIGIMVNFETAYKNAAKSLGKNTAELTEQEKLQARVNAVMAQGPRIAGTYEAAMESAGKKLASTQRYADDLKVSVGEIFQPTLAAGVDAYAAALKVLSATMDDINKKVVGMALKDFLATPDPVAAVSPWGAVYDFIKRIIVAKRKEADDEVEANTAESQNKQVAIVRDAAERRKNIDSELAELQKMNLEDVLKKAQATLKEAEAAAEKYAQKVIELEKAKELAQMSTQERVRALLRTQMGEQEAYNDSLKEAQETLARARQAAEQGQGEEAVKWAEKAQGQFERLNREVKDGEQIFVNAATANKTAVQGVLEAGTVIAQAYDTMKTAAQESQKAEEGRKTQILSDIKEIETAMDRIEALEVEVSANDQATPTLKDIQEELAKIKDKTITIKVNYDVGPKPDGLARGGKVPGYAVGGKLPGYSRADNMLGMLRGGLIGLAGGEFITQAFATRLISRAAPGLQERLNAAKSVVDVQRILARFAAPRVGYAGGGAVNVPLSMSGSSEALTVTFRAGDLEAPVKITDRTSRESMKAFARELQKIRLVQG